MAEFGKEWFKKALELKEKGFPIDEISDMLDVPYDIVREKFEEENISKNKKVKVKEGFEEKKPQVVDMEDYFLITSISGDRRVEITKSQLKELKQLYCDKPPLTINQVCYKLDIPRRDFYLIKTAFGITHDDVPFLDEELTNKSPEELVKETLERAKGQYFIKLQQEEIAEMRRELTKYRKTDYFYDKVIRETVVPQRPLRFSIRQGIASGNEGLLNLADWHTGLKTINYWNKYSLKIQEQRLKEITEKTIMYINRHNISKMHVMNLGDVLHGAIHVPNRIEAECDVIDQMTISWNWLADILETIAKIEGMNEVNFYSVHGNHSRLKENKQDAIDRENLERLIPSHLEKALRNIKNIKIVPNKKDLGLIEAKICGNLVYGIHGDKDKPEKAASNLTMMFDNKPLAIFTAHAHHKELVEEHKVDVIMSRSLCGVEEYASNNVRKTSKAGQSFYVWNRKGIECTYDMTF